jgi:hypothetical protein
MEMKSGKFWILIGRRKGGEEKGIGPIIQAASAATPLPVRVHPCNLQFKGGILCVSASLRLRGCIPSEF